MASRSFFLQRPEDALRHLNLLAKSLKKLALVGFVGGAGCSVMALLLRSFLVSPAPLPNAPPGLREMSGITLVASFMAIALLAFSALYFVSGWGLSHQKAWGRYIASGTFLVKLLLCVWLGRATFSSMFVFLLIASWDIYGLWVLLSKTTGQLFVLPQTNQTRAKPAVY